ncbi:MAG: hypothetical protein U5K30_11750 [Acidimicrobiales bacterium]|nr:hypothetical protein [Acidimicrobiales bacterium]
MTATAERPTLPDGVVAIVKRDCPTCTLVEPVLQRVHGGGVALAVYSQDDPGFPAGLPVVDDRDLTVSHLWDIETVPTLLRIEDRQGDERLVGWDREQWRGLFGDDDLGDDLPEWRPGCGSLSVDPTRLDELRVRFSASGLRSRRVTWPRLEDPFEAMFDAVGATGSPWFPPPRPGWPGCSRAPTTPRTMW